MRLKDIPVANIERVIARRYNSGNARRLSDAQVAELAQVELEQPYPAEPNLLHGKNKKYANILVAVKSGTFDGRV
jgi:hypothetical protein